MENEIYPLEDVKNSTIVILDLCIEGKRLYKVQSNSKER